MTNRFALVFFGLLASLGVLAWASVVHAVLPPDHYARMSEESEIKAIATVTEVTVLDQGKYYTTKSVAFRLEYALTPGTPQVFHGTCKSVDQEWQEPLVGGNIYFYPEVGQRVFVTVLSDGSQITSLTAMTPELERAVREAPETIRYGMGDAYVGE